MRRATHGVTCLLALALLVGCVGYRPYQGPPFEVMARGVARRVEAIREQPLHSLVSIQEVGPEALDRFIEDRLAVSYPGDLLEREARSLVQLGMLEEGVDLGESTRDLYRSHLLAFYDPDLHLLGLVPQALNRTRMEVGLARELVLAHELTHALQDQRVELNELLSRTARAGSDRHLATLALLEGEAQAVMYGYVLSGSGKRLENVAGDLGEALTGGVDPAGNRRGPDQESGSLETRTFGFPYRSGASFVQAVHRAGGWPAVTRLLEEPVITTEQVLHPEKYTPTRDEPQELLLPGRDLLLQAGWEPYHQEILGELGVQSLLERYLSPREAREAAIGWDGDALHFEVSQAGRLGLIWITTWDREVDAIEFFDAWQRLVPLRRPGASPGESAGGQGRTGIMSWELPDGGVHWSDRTGRDVVIIEGFPEELTNGLVAATRNVPRAGGQSGWAATDAETTARAQERALARPERPEPRSLFEIGGTLLRDPARAFSVRRPPGGDWHLVETRPDATRRVRLQRLHPLDRTRLLPHRFFNIDVLPLQLPLNLEQIAHQTERQLAFMMGNFRKLGSRHIELAGEPALELRYRGTLGDTALRFHQVTLLHGGYQYILTGGAPVEVYEEDHQDLVAMVNSFRLE